MNTTATTQDPYRCEGIDMDFLLANAEPDVTLAERIRHTTMKLLAGEATTAEQINELHDAVTALVKVTARLVRPADNRAVVLRAIRDAKQPSGWSAIADVRNALTHLDRTAQDELLIGMVRDGLVHATPVENAKALTGRDHAAALLLGNRWTHAIQAI